MSHKLDNVTSNFGLFRSGGVGELEALLYKDTRLPCGVFSSDV